MKTKNNLGGGGGSYFFVWISSLHKTKNLCINLKVIGNFSVKIRRNDTKNVISNVVYCPPDECFETLFLEHSFK